MEKRNRIYIYLLLILSLSVLILNLFLFFSTYKVLEVSEIDTSFNVSTSLGFDLNDSSLSFGNVLSESTSIRKISVVNNYDFEVLVRIYGENDVEDFIYPSEEKLGKMSSEEIGIILNIPRDTSLGSYSGKTIVEISTKRINKLFKDT